MSTENLAYEIRVNDDEPVVTGAAELSVLSAMLTHVRDRGGADLSVAGLVIEADDRHEHLRWLDRPLAAGDTLTIRVVATDDCAPPVSREVVDPNVPRAPQ